MLRFVEDQEEGADITGRLTIGDVSPIVVESAYLDSWLAALLECMTAMKRGVDRHEVDLVEEPGSLVATKAGEEVSLQFDVQLTKLGPARVAVRDMAADVRELLSRHRFTNAILLQEIEASLVALNPAYHIE